MTALGPEERPLLAARGWNDRHLAAVIERLRLALAARVAPGRASEADLAPRLAELDRTEAEAEAMLRAAGLQPTLMALAQGCGLDGFAISVLALCLAVELDADAAAMLPRVGVGGRVTPGLALALDGGGAPSRALAFAPDAPLLALRLVEIEPGLPLAAAPMRLAPRVRDLLLGHDRLDEATMGWWREVPPLRLPPALQAAAKAAAARLAGGQGLLALTGMPEAGGIAVAAEAARAAGLRPMRLATAALPAPDPPTLGLLAREARLSRLALLLDLHEAPPPALVEALVAAPPGLLLVAGPHAAALPAGAPVIALPEPDLIARAAMWQAAAPDLGHPAALRLARQFSLPPERMARLAEGIGEEAALWQRLREGTAPALAELGDRIVPRAGWDDLVLPADARAALQEVAAAAAARATIEGEWGFAQPGARGQGMAVLLAGPSGTGKTLAAEVLAGTLGLDLFRIDLAGVVSKWIGETEKNLRRIFDAAEAGGAVLFFDEADALFGKRSEVKDSHDRHANIEVAYLLQRMEAHRGLSILATNLRASLDQAFLRRLRFAIDLPFPDEAARRQIWARHLPPRAPRAAIDLDALARLDLPGGAIRNVVLNGASLAAAAGQKIGTAHLMAAARREFAKLGRLPTGGAR